MKTTADLLKIGQKAIITNIDVDKIPLKLLEMGCLPGNELEIIQIAPFGDPIYLNVNNGFLIFYLQGANFFYGTQNNISRAFKPSDCFYRF